MKKIQDADVKGKKVLLRVDFNVPVEDGKVEESFKIKAAKKTLDYLSENGAKVAMISHLGRPDGKIDPKFSLKQVKNDAEALLGRKIIFVSDCIGKEVKEALIGLSVGDVLLLENVRFHEEDEKNDDGFSRQLADGFDIFVNDAFSASHRDHASVTGVAKFIPGYAGMRLQKEISEMEKIKNEPIHPAVAIIGGAKIETKLPVINFFEKSYDTILVGGKIANEAIDQTTQFSEKVILPMDYVDDRMDIGPNTIAKFKEVIKSAKTVIWNGPMGKFEEDKYAQGSNEILASILDSGAYTVVGGGETLEILEKNNAMDKMGFVSTGGGAMLDYLGGHPMPGIEILKS